MKRTHALIIGGTGMLRPVAIHLAEQGYTVSVVARDIEKLRSLIAETQKARGLVNMIPVDYRETENLKKKTLEAIAILGPFSLVISWIHDTAPEATPTLAATIEDQGADCRYFDILSVGAESSSGTTDDRKRVFESRPHIWYRQVILGSTSEGTATRSLTSEQIEQGVLDAIRQDVLQKFIG